MLRAFLTVAVCACLAGCSLLLGLDALRVTDWRPREAQLDAAAAGEVWVEFSADVDQTKAEQAFSLSENGSPMTGRFAWSGRRLVFVPLRAVSPGNNYEIAVLSTAETRDGNSLAKDFRFAFTTKTETGRPAVVSFEPANGSRVDPLVIPPVPVRITFSEPIDQASFMAAFSISPDPGGSITVAGSAATFNPLAPWAAGTEYDVTLTDAVKDLSGNHLPAALEFRFTASNDAGRPILISATPTGTGASGVLTASVDQALVLNEQFEATWGIALTFSKQVLRENLESFLDFEPAWGCQIDPDCSPRTTFVLMPKERLTWDSLYCLTVKKGVLDTSGNASASDIRFMLKVNGARTRPPSVEYVRFRKNPDEGSPEYDDYAPSDTYKNLDLSNFTPGLHVVSYFDLYLHLADGAAIDPFSLMGTFSITTSNGAAIITPTAVTVGSFADPQPLAKPGLVPARVAVDVISTTNSGVITLSVSDGLMDTLGNKAAAAFGLPLLK